MNERDQLVMEIVSIARNFNQKELNAMKAYIRALDDGKTPEEAWRAGDAVLHGAKGV